MRFMFLLIFLVSAAVGLTGCETIKGASQGFKEDVKNTWSNVTRQDGFVKKSDDWVQENMW